MERKMKKKRQQDHRQKGFSLVELMVGITVGLLVIFAGFAIFGNAERNYRATETVNNAQINGLYAVFAVSQELGNAGAGVMSNYASLRRCTAVSNFPENASGSPSFPLYPLPAAIIPRSAATDDLYIFYGTGSVTDLAMSVGAVDVSNRSFSLAAPLGLAPNSVLLKTTGANCAAFAAENITPPGTDGSVTVTVGTGQTPDGLTAGEGLIDMGAVARRRFFVDGQGTLQMQVWTVDSSVGNNNWRVESVFPIAANVVFFRAQYGLSTSADGNIDQWLTPEETTLNQIMSDTISAQSIKAIRFGLIVRADEPDTTLKDAPDYTERFFVDCPGGECTDPQQVTLVVSQSGEPFGWRYRKYETTVPLRNAIWN